MKLHLPIFPRETKLLTTTLGVYSKEGIICYVHCGVPVYSHRTEDMKSFRYITSKFIAQGLCKKIDISRCFGVSYDSVNRYVKKLEELGDQGFFARDNRGGSCYKLVLEVVERMQGYLDAGKNNSAIARRESVTEGAVRSMIKKGILQKKEQAARVKRGVIVQKRSIDDRQSRREIATTRESDRVGTSLGGCQEAVPVFEHANNLCNAGVLFMLPALLSQGLLKGEEI